jgi:uncharacterized OB-fold protein
VKDDCTLHNATPNPQAGRPIGDCYDTVMKSLTEPFWEAAAKGVLVRQVCSRCAFNIFSPQIACPNCQSEQYEWQESSGLGSVYSFSEVFREPLPGYAAPFTIAIVDLDEGWSMLTHVVGDRDVTIGASVRVDFDGSRGDRVLPVFALLEASSPGRSEVVDV